MVTVTELSCLSSLERCCHEQKTSQPEVFTLSKWSFVASSVPTDKMVAFLKGYIYPGSATNDVRLKILNEMGQSKICALLAHRKSESVTTECAS